MVTTGVQIRDMRSEVSAILLEDIYREVLEPSFGSDELDSLDTLRDGLAERGSYQTWGLCAMDGEKPVGCLLGYPYRKSQVLLVGYLSVKPGIRDLGIGGLLFDEAQQRWSGKPDVKLVVAEVEDPRRYPIVDDIDPKRRVEFYARRGAQFVVGPYFQPRLDGTGTKRVYNLFLTVLSGSGDAISPENSVSAATLTNFLLDYFRASGEGSDWPRAYDEEGTRLLAWYRDREVVPLHPLGDYEQIEVPPITDRR